MNTPSAAGGTEAKAPGGKGGGGIDGVWIGSDRSGVRVARPGPDGCFLVDRPTERTYRERRNAKYHDGRPVVDQIILRPVAPPGEMFPGACGWYDGDERTVLLTWFAEAALGEPMVLLAEDDAVVRVYPLIGGRLLAEDGRWLDLTNGGLRITDGDDTAVFVRSPRFTESGIAFEAAGHRYGGTVITPAGPGPHPAAVMLHGAAGGQRDFCRLLGWPVLDAGVALLIYDKRGTGVSSDDPEPTIFDQADAATAAYDLLAGLDGIDAARVGLAGFSNGMWSAPIVAGNRPRTAFITGIGAPGVSIAESEAYRRMTVLREAGVGDMTVAAVGEAWRAIFTIAGAGTAAPRVAADLAIALGQTATAPDLKRYEIPAYARQNPMVSPVPPAIPAADLIAMITEGGAEPQLTYDPASDYRRVRCPVLLQYGSRDSNVPVATSVQEIASALRSSGAKLSSRVYDGLEHMLNEVPDVDGLTAEEAMHGFHAFRFGPGVHEDLIEWLSDTLGLERHDAGDESEH